MSVPTPSPPADRDKPRLHVPLRLRIGVLVMVALASSSAYLTRHCLAVANTTIQAELNLNSEQMGYVFSLFALGYMIFQIPGGAIGLRCGLWTVVINWGHRGRGSIRNAAGRPRSTRPVPIAGRGTF